MNRAILIVICDFLVSAMLSMMTGMVAAHSGGTGVGLDETTTRMLLAELENKRSELEQLRNRLREATVRLGATPEREAELRRLAAELAANLRRTEELRGALERTPETTGELTPEELKKRLDAEIERRLRTEIELKDKSTDLNTAKENLTSVRSDLAAARSEAGELRRTVSTTGEAMARLSDEMIRTRTRLSEADAKVAVAEQQAEQQRRELAARESDLAGVREALREMSDRVGRVTRESQTLQTSLAVTGNRLNAAERDLADYRGRVEQLRRKLLEQELAERDARRQRDEMQKVVKRTVAEYSKTRVELEQTKKVLDESRKAAVDNTVKLQVANRRLAEVEKRLRNDVLSSYSSATLEVDIDVREDRLISELRGGGRYYLPVVDFGGRPLLVGYFSLFAGDADRAMSFNRVTAVEYAARTPGKADTRQVLPGPLQAVRRDPRVAAVEIKPAAGIRPLRLLTAEQLKKRGMRELHLFKFSTFGGASVELTDRCSVDFSGSTPTMVIRNNSRGVGGELRAGVGDFVMTREGDFVGVVVAVDEIDYGKREEARVFLFNGRDDWTNPVGIPLEKQGGRYLDAYSAGVKAVKTAIESRMF